MYLTVNQEKKRQTTIYDLIKSWTDTHKLFETAMDLATGHI